MPNASLLHVLRPNRSEQRITALRTLIENAFGFRRFRFTNLHDDTSLFSFLRTENLASLCDSKNTIIQSRAGRDRHCEQLVVSRLTFGGHLSQVRNESDGKRSQIVIAQAQNRPQCKTKSKINYLAFEMTAPSPSTIRERCRLVSFL
jgi:hypothetical protein